MTRPKIQGNTQTGIDKLNDRLWANRFDDSRAVAAEALRNLAKAEKSKYQKGIAYSKLIIAAANFLQSKNDNALKYLTEAWKWFEKNSGEKGYPRAILLKGNIFESFGDYEKTLSLWLEAYKASIENNDVESEGESCSQLGLIYSRLCDFDKALEYFNKGLKIREELGDENAVASSLNRIGMVLRQMNRYDESLEYYFRSLDIRNKNRQTSAIPWTLLGIANTYEDMRMYPESLEYYEKGMKGSDKRCSLQCLMGSGRIFSRRGEVEKAETRLTGSLRIAQDLKSLVLLADAHSALATHYELSGQPEKALKSFKQFFKVKESYQSSETRSRMSNIEVANAIERSEQEKEIFRLRHVELKQAYDLIEEKNRDITASISYASRIQHAILPDLTEIRGLTKKCFILYIPKDIVSGDFYWFSRRGEKLVMIAGDCTGHGVPGALMSMLGISFLEEIINRRGIIESGDILNNLRSEILRALHQKGIRKEAKDGMDISLCILDSRKKAIQYSGAYNSLYLIRDRMLTEYKADRMPIGIFDLCDKDFVSQDIPVSPGDMIYMFSDGFADQFGGPNNKKFGYSPLKALLTDISALPLPKQKKQLEKQFIDWKGDSEQIDDVLIMGFRI
jgi:serine phosphatase RsbU (regulator of sigma subunit)